MLITRLLFVALSGFGLHQTYELTKEFGERWGSMMREAIGMLGMLPCILFLREGIDERREVQRWIVSYLLAAFAFGAGVMGGHLFDRMKQ